MEPEASLHNLKVAAIGNDLSFVHSRTSSVTTSWGVDWDEEFIARDLMQNFFDANRHCLAEVKVEVTGHTVSISAPVPMELARLFYLGSEKGDEDVGKYGEGFKVATVCLLRNHNIEPIIQSGDQVMYVRLDGETVSGTQLRPLVYDFFASATPYTGTRLVLRGCAEKLITALQTGLSHFFFEANPLLGARLWASYDGHFSIYRATTANGHVFYRRLKRGVISDVPVALVIDKQFERIEKKTRQDRDRNAFGEELMKLFYEVFARSGLRHSVDGQRLIVEAARPCWPRGHPLLSHIAEAQRFDRWPAKMSKEVFGAEFFARAHAADAAQALQYEAMEKDWQKQGRKPLPAYFKAFGVLNAIDHAAEIKRLALEEQKKRHQRPPTYAERDCLDLLHEIIRSLAPSLSATLQQYQVVFSVAETDILLGELKQHREYRSAHVFLSSKVFVRDFAEALAIFLHEHAHVFGYDGSRAFTDALTQLLETVVRHRKELDPFEQKWNGARAAVQGERKDQTIKAEIGSVEDTLGQMNENQLRELLKRVPEMRLRRALNDPSDRAAP